jgi:glutamine amidotransferase
MCRHVAYLGPPASLRSLLIDPPHSLYRQSWAPRRQRHGTVNADGFGVGWYAGGDPVPARYRRGGPMWADPSLPDIARVTRSGAVLAAVRSATPGTAAGDQAAAPFGDGPWLFSHNGRLNGWPASAAPLAGGSGAGVLLSLEAMVDSAFLWALVLERLRAGRAMGDALAATIAAAEAAGATGRFNFLLTDGHSVAATACGDTLWYRLRAEGTGRTAAGPADGLAPAGPSSTGPPGPSPEIPVAEGSVTVASEPSDDGPGWTEVPDRHLLTATARGVSLRPLPAGDRATACHATAAGRAAGGSIDIDRLPIIDSDARTEGIVS